MGDRLTAARKRVTATRRRAAGALLKLLTYTDSAVVTVGLGLIVYGVSMFSTAVATILAGVFVTAIGVGRMRA